MPIPVAVRRAYKLGNVPEDYRAGWMRQTLAYISRAIWQPVSRAVIASTTVDASDELLLVDCTAGGVTVTFPPAIQMQFAQITVKKVDSGANVITLAGTVDSVVNMTIPYPMMSLTIQSDGASWWIK